MYAYKARHSFITSNCSSSFLLVSLVGRFDEDVHLEAAGVEADPGDVLQDDLGGVVGDGGAGGEVVEVDQHRARLLVGERDRDLIREIKKPGY